MRSNNGHGSPVSGDGIARKYYPRDLSPGSQWRCSGRNTALDSGDCFTSATNFASNGEVFPFRQTRANDNGYFKSVTGRSGPVGPGMASVRDSSGLVRVLVVESRQLISDPIQSPDSRT